MSDLILVQENSTPETVELVSAGPQGPSGTFIIGTITTGLAGSSANVTNTGTPSQAVLNFTIPRGDVGDVTPEATAAKNAAQSASSAAATSQVVASNAATSATASASSAQQSATAAASSSSTATSKAAEASTSAASAESSEIVALGASSTATLKASEAGSFATAASTSAASSETSANASASYAAAASGSANASATSAGNASGSASLAQEWATKTISEVALGQGYGAKKYALDAASMAAAAEIAAAGSLVHSQTAAGHSQSASTSADNANISASVSSDASVLATLRAGQAAESASTSSSQAANASASAATATSQASSATTSASTASTQAGIATTKASEASTSASAASVSAAAALASQTASAGSAAAANTSAGSAAGSASSALAIYGTTNAQQAALMAAQSAASLAQGFALSASSAIQQDLSGVTAQALHRSPNAVTAMFVYDTSKDSDGGAWTEKCQHTSWYNEALNGKWLGAQDTEFQARHAGATVSSTEVLTNGTFDSNITGWTAGAGSAAWAAGTAQITGSSGVIARLFQAMTLTAGKTYRLTATCVSTTDTSTTLEFLGGSVSTTFNAGQTKSLYFSAASTGTFYAQVRNTNAGAVVSAFDNISVREVTALTTASGDYYQSTVDGKFYRLWKNLLSYSNNFENAAWTKGVSTVSPDAVAGPDGAVTADAIVESTTSGNQGLLRTLQDYGRKTFAFDVKAGGRQYFTMGWFAGDNSYLARLTVDLANGSVTQWAAPTGGGNDYTYTVTPKGNGWYRIAGSYTRGAGGFPSRVWFGPSDTSTASGESKNYLGDGRTAIYLSNFQVEEGSTATAYEARGADGSVTETFRGNKADFPRLAGIVAEAANVTIYDLTEAGRPMWMRFIGTTANGGILGGYGYAFSVSSLACLNATLSVPMSLAYNGVSFIDFAKDSARRINDVIYLANPLFRKGVYNSGISNRNNTAFAFENSLTVGIASSLVNAVAMTVLPDAPVDAVTGLQVPTIAVATAGGVSVIKHDGTVVSHTQNVLSDSYNLVITKDGCIAYHNGGGPLRVLPIAALPVANTWYFYSPSPVGESYYIPQYTQITGKPVNGNRTVNYDSPNLASLAPGNGTKITLAKNGYDLVVGGTYLKRAKNNTLGLMTASLLTPTGFMRGDIRRAYLADVDVGSVSGTELVTNGTFDTDVSGWTAQVSTVDRWSVVNGKLTLNASGDAAIWQGVPTVVGKTYQARVTSAGVADAQIRFINSNNINGAILGTVVVPNTGSLVYNFTATTTFAVFQLRANTAGATYDDVSLKEVVADRSYKASGAPITGTLTKTQVAGAASQLVAYSGFSAANYLREPYSADLDFGTGEWSASAWVNVPVTLNESALPSVSANLVPNGALTSDISGWVIYGLAAPDVFEWSAGRLHVVNTGSNRSLFGTGASAVTAGKRYRIQFDIEVVSGSVGGGVNSYQFGQAFSNFATIPLGSSTVVAYFTATSTGNIHIQLDSYVNYEIYIDNASITEIEPFNICSRAHSSGPKISLGVAGGFLTATAFDGTTTRTVTTTAAYNTGTMINPVVTYTTDGTLAIRVNGAEVATTRGTPLLSLNSRYNLLTYTEDIANAAWAKTGGVTVVSNAIAAPDGTITADFVKTGSTLSTQRIQQSVVASGTCNFALYAKASGYEKITIWDHATTGAYASFNLTGAGSVMASGNGASNAAIQALANGWYLVSFSAAGSALTGFGVQILPPSNTTGLGFSDPWTPNGVDGVYIWGTDLRISTYSALPYQRVGALAETQVAPLTVGNSFAADAPFPGSISLLKLSATVPTLEQSQWMYEQEKQMFRDGAQVCLPDAGAIVDLTYDDATDKWIAVSATNESEWSGLVRTSVTASPAGSYTKVFAASGVQLQARSTTNPGVDITIPSYGLREELVNRSQAAARLARNMVVFDYVGGFTANTTTGATSITSVASLAYPVSYVGARISGAGIPANTTVVAVSGTTIYMSAAATATASAVQISFVDFTLPVGYEAKNVLSAGATKVEGATKDFTRLFDGFKETIRFGTAPGFNVPVQIQATRSVQ